MLNIIKSIGIIALLLLSCACTNNKNAKPEISGIILDTLAPDQISYNLTINFVDSSLTKAIISARRGRIYIKDNYSMLDSGVRVIFYSKSGNSSGILTADEIKINDITKNMFAKGNVIVVSDSTKSRLETQEMEWRNNERKLFSEAFVKITSAREVIEGYGFESDQNLSNYKIFKVSGVVSNE